MAGRGWCWGFQGLRCSVKMGHVLSRPQRRGDQVASEGCPGRVPVCSLHGQNHPKRTNTGMSSTSRPSPGGQDRTAGAEGEGAGFQTQPPAGRMAGPGAAPTLDQSTTPVPLRRW